MEGYMHTIVLTTKMNNIGMDIDPLNTYMTCGSIQLNPINYTLYIENLDYNMST